MEHLGNMDSPSPLHTLDPNIPTKPCDTKDAATQKPLPPPPPHPFDRTVSEAPVPGMTTYSPEFSSHVARPSSSGGASFARPRKRVVWRNKVCMIALPIDSEFGKKTTRESYLRPEDVARSLQDWEDKGLNTKGFLLAPPISGSLPCFSEGQSREVHPNLEGMTGDVSGGTYRVSIPNMREWEAYVNRLKEEKLRALGVSFGDEDLSRKSPVSSIMSRQASSQSSFRRASPGLGPQSMYGMPYVPGIKATTTSSIHPCNPSVSHFPRYSVAMPYGEKPPSPSNQMPRPGNSPVHSVWPPQQYLGSQSGSRINSPNAIGQPQTLNHSKSPVPSPMSNTISQTPSQDPGEMLDSMRRQQALLQAQQLRQQHQQQMLLQSRLLPSTGGQHQSESKPLSAPSHNHADISSPIPRSHRQNLSENLQKETDKVGYSQELHKEPKSTSPHIVADEEDIPRDQEMAAKISEEALLPNSTRKTVDLRKSPNSPATSTDPNICLNKLQHGHSCKASTSKLNVNAPEFKYEPKKSINQDVFAFSGHQEPLTSEGKMGPTDVHSKQVQSTAGGPTNSTTKLSISAPEFTPGASARKPTVPSREFSFSASVPTIKPQALSNKSDDPGASSIDDARKGEQSAGATNKIFGDVKYTDVVKPAKSSRAIPIVNPDETSASLAKMTLEEDGQEDESGRITQVDGRQKRMRRELKDEDAVALFASPNQTPWMDHGGNERPAYFSRTPSPSSEKLDATTLEAATDLLEEIIDDLSATEASDLMKDEDSYTEDGKLFEPHAFHDIDDAVKFNAARPPSSLQGRTSQYLDPTASEIEKATVAFLKKSPQYKADLDQAIEQRASSFSTTPLEYRERDDSLHSEDHIRQHIMDGVRYIEPSYNELNAIMTHLNEDFDRGVERRSSPFRRRGQSISPVRSSAPEHRHTSRSPMRYSTQDLYHESYTPLLLPANPRSDAPSPSQNRLRVIPRIVPHIDSESAKASTVEHLEQIARGIANNPLDSPSWPSKNAIPIHHLNSPGSTPPSDWNDAISSFDEGKFQSRTGFFDNRVNEVVGSVVQQRLEPLEQALSKIQQSLSALTSRSASRRPRSSSKIEILNSDADDEDDTGEPSQPRLKSPLRDRKVDQLKSGISDILAAQQTFAPATLVAEVMNAVRELKVTITQAPPLAQSDNNDIRNIIEEAIGKQLRGRSAPVTSSSAAAVAEKSQLQIAGLETLLKVADSRADDELKARRSTEDALADNQRLLRSALQDAAEQRESAEATERTLEEHSEEWQEMLQQTAMLERSEESLQKSISDLSDKNAALEDTLAEYRLSSGQWRIEIDDARHENKDLRRHMTSLKAEVDESTEIRTDFRRKLEHLREEMSRASQETAVEQTIWRGKEQEHQAKLESLGTSLESEARARQRLEVEVERLESQQKEGDNAQVLIEQMQEANRQLRGAITELRFESDEHQKAMSYLERELHDAREGSMLEVQRTRAAMGTDVEAANARVKLVRNDLESVIARLHKQIEDIMRGEDDARARYECILGEANECRKTAIREAAQAKEAALQEQSRLHERIIKELEAHNERAMRIAVEDKQRSETYFGNRLNLADEKAVHYQDRAKHLEDKLEIAKSAAHAAVQAVQAKKNTLHPFTAYDAQSLGRASGLPEKISPQALRESIAVLQEQLQERESRIEQLEHELSLVDASAPAKIKEAEIEITWLRELLGVRIDDLEDIITTLSQYTYDREAVKDAAIRLKANLQMEQQEKERAFAGVQPFPSLSSISNLAASPKALPLAAAAAWGNWRKGREGFGSLSALAGGSLQQQQTPSKSSSPQNFFAGLMTPPNTNMRTTPPIASNSRPVHPSSSSRHALRPPTTPQHNLNARNTEIAQQDPVTPPLMRRASYDLDACESVAGFRDEDVQGSRTAGADEEPFGPRLGGIIGML